MVLRMASPTKSEHGVYYYIVRIPTDLVPKLGSSLIKESLKTKDPDEAKRLFATRHQKSLHQWETLRSDIVELTHKQTIALTGQRYKFWNNHFQDNPGPANELQRLLDLSEGVEHDDERLETWYGSATDKLLSDEGLRISPERRLILMREIHRTDLQVIKVLKRNAEGDYTPDSAEKRFPDWSTERPQKNGKNENNSDSITYLFSVWKKEHLANEKRPETVRDFEQKIESLAEFVAPKKASEVTTKDVSDWCDELRHSKGLAASTVANKYLAAVRSVYKLGVLKQQVKSDPTHGYRIHVPKNIKSRSPGFSNDEAQTILSQSLRSETQLGKMSKHNKLAIRWIPWLCAFTGARGGEIGQLRKQDFLEDHDIPYLRLTPEAGGIKTGNFRHVPIHPQLIEIGLIEFINGSDQGPLFFAPNGVEDNPRKLAANAYEKVRKWVRNTVGITDKRIQPNHAWRHRFKTLCRDYDISEEYSDWITGHEDGRAGAGYGEVSVKALHREIVKLPHIKLPKCT